MPHAHLRTSTSALAKPLYAQVRTMLLDRIRNNEWPHGSSLPNEFALASHYNVSIGTVRRAVEGLEKAGVLVRKQGRGTFVARPEQTAFVARFGLLRSPASSGLALAYHLRGFARRKATVQECVRLRLMEGAEVLEMNHLVEAKSGVCGMETGAICVAAVVSAEGGTPAKTHPYTWFAEMGVIVTRVEDRLSALPASAEQAELLQLPEGAPVLQLERVAYALDDIPIEARTAVYRTTEQLAFACGSGLARRLG